MKITNPGFFALMCALSSLFTVIMGDWFPSFTNKGDGSNVAKPDYNKGWTTAKDSTMDDSMKQWSDSISEMVQNFQDYDTFHDWAKAKGEKGMVYISLIPDAQTFSKWIKYKLSETTDDVKNWASDYSSWMSQKASQTVDYAKKKTGEVTQAIKDTAGSGLNLAKEAKDRTSEVTQMAKDTAGNAAKNISEMFPDYDSVKKWAQDKGEQGKKLLQKFPDYESFSNWIKGSGGDKNSEDSFMSMFPEFFTSSSSSSSSKSRDNKYDYESFQEWAKGKGEEGVSILKQIPSLESFENWISEHMIPDSMKSSSTSSSSSSSSSILPSADSLKQKVKSSFEDASLMFSRFSTPMDIRELDTNIELQVDVPGVSRDNLNVEVRQNVLYIESYRHSETRKDDGTYHYHERYDGKSQRSFPLPVYADDLNIKAVLDHGVLKISIPKIPSKTPGGFRKVSIADGGSVLPSSWSMSMS